MTDRSLDHTGPVGPCVDLCFCSDGPLLEGVKQKGELVGFTFGKILSAAVLRAGCRAQAWKQGDSKELLAIIRVGGAGSSQRVPKWERVVKCRQPVVAEPTGASRIAAYGCVKARSPL